MGAGDRDGDSDCESVKDEAAGDCDGQLQPLTPREGRGGEEEGGARGGAPEPAAEARGGMPSLGLGPPVAWPSPSEPTVAGAAPAAAASLPPEKRASDGPPTPPDPDTPEMRSDPPLLSLSADTSEDYADSGSEDTRGPAAVPRRRPLRVPPCRR